MVALCPEPARRSVPIIKLFVPAAIEILDEVQRAHVVVTAQAAVPLYAPSCTNMYTVAVPLRVRIHTPHECAAVVITTPWKTALASRALATAGYAIFSAVYVPSGAATSVEFAVTVGAAIVALNFVQPALSNSSLRSAR